MPKFFFHIRANQGAVLTGWGSMTKQGNTSMKLHQSQLIVELQRICNWTYGTIGKGNPISQEIRVILPDLFQSNLQCAFRDLNSEAQNGGEVILEGANGGGVGQIRPNGRGNGGGGNGRGGQVQGGGNGEGQGGGRGNGQGRGNGGGRGPKQPDVCSKLKYIVSHRKYKAFSLFLYSSCLKPNRPRAQEDLDKYSGLVQATVVIVEVL